MKNIGIIFKREYLTRIKNKAFILMTLFGPLIFVAFYAAIGFIAYQTAKSDKVQELRIVDTQNMLPQTMYTDTVGGFVLVKWTQPIQKNELKEVEENVNYLFVLDKQNKKLDSVEFISSKSPSISKLQSLSSKIEEVLFEQALQKNSISKKMVDSLKPKVDIKTSEFAANGAQVKSNSGIKSAIGMFMAFMIYIFIFVYGSMVMRSTMEEKTNKIVEVIVSSIRPFQLMMGKILGVAAVGLTQVLTWIILVASLSTIITVAFGSSILKNGANARLQGTGIQANQVEQAVSSTSGAMGMLESLQSLPFAKIAVVFLLFFIGGYLLYSSMFAAIGSSVSQESDAQQFMFPVSLPLIFGFVIAQSAVFSDPHGTIAKIFSFIPFTSPILMAVRVPFGVSWIEIFGSFAILALTFVFFVWLSGRIFRIGILSYGKKPRWKDFAKWIFTKKV